MIPMILSANGRLNRDPAEIRITLINGVAATNAGYTANLPLSLIEDVTSTMIAGISALDQAITDITNSVAPTTANEGILIQQGTELGIMRGVSTNGNAFVTFTGTVGYSIPKGFVVSDGAHQYAVQNGGIIGAAGTLSLYVVATTVGTWAIPANTITINVTSVPSPLVLTCTNPAAGNAGIGVESIDAYRARINEAMLAPVVGSMALVKANIKNLSGVVARSVSIQRIGALTKIIVGGGDPYQIANAIMAGLFDFGDLAQSQTLSRNISVSVNDYPDTYLINYVSAQVQAVGITVTWATYYPNFTSDAALVAACQQPIADYINSLPTGNSINTDQIKSAFLTAVAAILPPQYISNVVLAVTIDGVLTPVISGTNLIPSSSEGYFTCAANNVLFVRQ